MPNQFCIHQKCSLVKSPHLVCGIYKRDTDHPVCAFEYDASFAFFACKHYEEVKQPKTLEEYILIVNKRIDQLEYKMDKLVLRLQHILGKE